MVIDSLPTKKHEVCARSDIIGTGEEILDGCGHYSHTLDVCGRCSRHCINVTRRHYELKPRVSCLAPPAGMAVRRISGFDSLESVVRKRPVFCSDRDYHRFRRNGTGLASLFASPADARRALRRQVLYWCVHQRGLLPLHLSCTCRKRKERSLLSNRRRSRGGRLPPLLALSS
jgi:hypothetical protein